MALDGGPGALNSGMGGSAASWVSPSRSRTLVLLSRGGQGGVEAAVAVAAALDRFLPF